MTTQRSNRKGIPRAALVGYTNVGKSTLMNVLSKSDVFSENKLFATLDTTVRKVVINNFPFLLSDTVGFIRKLPTQLVESFKSTLDEIRESDLLIHIVDISHPNFEEQMDSVNKVLDEINSIEKPMIIVFNKIDAYVPEPWDETELIESRSKKNYSISEWKKTWMNSKNNGAVFISARMNNNIGRLKKEIFNKVKIFSKTYNNL